MRSFSRWMPPARQTSRAQAIGCVGALVVAATWLVWRYPWILPMALLVIALGSVLDRKRRARLRQMAAQRTGEGLCTFVRAFPRQERDPWILRALHEELQIYYCVDKLVVPIRPSDRLREDLAIDGDDLDDMAVTIAKRIGRGMSSSRSNPYYGRVATVADLVAFLKAQPRVAV